MIERLDALAALQRNGTLSRAAVQLRITQSAASKRIAALEAELGRKLVEPDGRKLRLTPDAEHLLDEARPLLARLREVLTARAAQRPKPLLIAASDSLLASWLPGSLRSALDRLPALSVELHAHRGPMLLERVRSGDYALALCPALPGDKDLIVRELAREPMVIVPARLKPIAPAAHVEVWAIETQSLTWDATETRLAHVKRSTGFAVRVVGRLESFTALVQVARAGFANALVPIGVARELGVPNQKLVPLGDLSRPIAAVGRRTAFKQPVVSSLLTELSRTLAESQARGFRS
jgi:DNA-binding transcriptional LysR family regulator